MAAGSLPLGAISKSPVASSKASGSERSKVKSPLLRKLIWVAVDDREELVGFALCSDRREDLYLDQLSVLPRHSRRGLGTRLVRRCLQEAEARAFRRVSLSTFRKVPWNGPFYRTLGFREVPVWRLNDWQLEIRELQRQTMDVRLRCFMQRSVKRAR